MTWQISVTLAVLACCVAALSVLRADPDLILLGGLAVLLVTGILSPQEALGGFANEGLVTVAVLYVVAEGVRQTGAIGFHGQRLLGRPRSLVDAQARVIAPTALMSAFLNNTPVVAMLLPVLSDWARKWRLSVSHLLLPMSYAAILGGMCTLVGTSTTLVVNGLLIDYERQEAEDAATGPEASGVENRRPDGLSMFEIAWVGLPIAAAGLLYVLLCSRRLLPPRKPVMMRLEDPREYTVEMLVEPGSALVGRTIEDAGLRHLPGMYLMEIDRNGHILAAVAPTERLEANDRLVFVGIVESVVDLQRIPGLKPATEQLFKLDSPRSERCLVEAVVSNSCPAVRMTIRESKFRTRYNAVVIAVARNGQRIRKKIGDIELLPGDTLLLEADPSFVDVHRNSRDFFLVGRVDDSSPPRHERAWVARGILVAMIAVVTLGWLSMLKAAALAAGLMLASQCCSGADARRAIDWGVLLVIGAGLGIGKAMATSGTADLLASGLLSLVGHNPLGQLAVVYLVTMVLTNLITAKAAATLVFPIAVASAETLSTALGDPVSALPFIIALMISSAASFASPIGYQTNLMVYGPGGYRFSDYIRLGGPLSVIAFALTLWIVPRVWPF